jgi:hypothetical protein
VRSLFRAQPVKLNHSIDLAGAFGKKLARHNVTGILVGLSNGQEDASHQTLAVRLPAHVAWNSPTATNPKGCAESLRLQPPWGAPPSAAVISILADSACRQLRLLFLTRPNSRTITTRTRKRSRFSGSSPALVISVIMEVWRMSRV